MEAMASEEASAPDPRANLLSLWQRYKLPIVLGTASVILIIISLTLLIKSTQTTTPIRFSQAEPAASASGTRGTLVSAITVDVEGAVVRPGMYQLPREARVADALIAAGGLTEEADTDRIAATMNRAAKLVDGGKLYFPKKQDPNFLELRAQGPPLNSQVLSLVSVNRASQGELESLPGIGPVTAKKIIASRPYQTLEELVSKKAVGQSLFEKIKDQLGL